MSKKIVCPACGGTLRYVGSDSNGSTRVFCATDESHEIDTETWDAAVLIAEAAGY